MRTRLILVTVVLILSSATQILAQTAHSRVDISGGPTWFGVDEESPTQSWFLDGAVNLSNWFALAARADWSTSAPTKSFEYRYTRTINSGGTVIAQTYDLERVERQRTVLGGVRFVGRDSNHLAAVAQMLVGYNTRTAPATVTPNDDFARSVSFHQSGSGSGLVWQAGGGMAVLFSRHFGAIATMDYRRTRTIITGAMLELAEFTGVEDFDRTTNEINISLGMTVRLGRR